MALGIDPKVDYAFKKLFGSESNADLLINLLNAVLDYRGEEALVAVEILNPFDPAETDAAKFCVLDVKARDQLGRLYNIEMQLYGDRAFPERVL